jgi:hypothetical protein
MCLTAGKDNDNTTCPHWSRSTIICRPAVTLLRRLCYHALSRFRWLLCIHTQEFRIQIIKDLYTNFERYSVTDFIKVKNFKLQFNAYMMITMQIH